MTAAQVKAILARMKTTFPNSLKTITYRDKGATGIVPNSSFPSMFTDMGEQGTSAEKIMVDVDDLARPGNGEQAIVNGNAVLIDEAHADPTGAVYLISYHKQSPVTIDPENP